MLHNWRFINIIVFWDLTTYSFIDGHQQIKKSAASLILQMQAPGHSTNQTTWCYSQEHSYLNTCKIFI